MGLKTPLMEQIIILWTGFAATHQNTHKIKSSTFEKKVYV